MAAPYRSDAVEIGKGWPRRGSATGVHAGRIATTTAEPPVSDRVAPGEDSTTRASSTVRLGRQDMPVPPAVLTPHDVSHGRSPFLVLRHESFRTALSNLRRPDKTSQQTSNTCPP